VKCEDVAAAIPDYLTGEGDASSRSRMQDHMAECAPCRSEIEGLSETWTRLRVLEEARPSPALRAGFYAMLEAYPRDGEEAHRAPAKRSWWSMGSWAWVLRPAAALLLLGLGFTLGRFRLVPRVGSSAGAQAPVSAGSTGVGPRSPLALIKEASAGERLEGVALAGQVEHPDEALLNALLDTVENDPNVNVRLSAVESLFLFAHQPGIRERLTQSLDRQTSPVVQIALIDLLVASREKQAAEALAQLIKNRQIRPEVREHAEAGIKRLL
jgi:anti-sigma factor RsiW